MEPADSIRRVGFRKWYERSLIDAHLWLVTALLAAVLAAVLIEALPARGVTWGALLSLLVAMASVLTAWYGARRFLLSLHESQRWSEHSTCAKCEGYGRFKVLEAGGTQDTAWMKVECRKCGHRWSMP